MKCMECPDYKDCRRKNDLRRKRGKCAKAKDNYVPTNADRIRAMTDEELAERLKNFCTEEMEQGRGDIARLWCDGKAGCIDADGAIDCDDEKLTACILRWLQQPCGGADHE